MAEMGLMVEMVKEEHQDSEAQLVNQANKGDQENEGLTGYRVKEEIVVETELMVTQVLPVFRELLENRVSLESRAELVSVVKVDCQVAMAILEETDKMEPEESQVNLVTQA